MPDDHLRDSVAVFGRGLGRLLLIVIFLSLLTCQIHATPWIIRPDDHTSSCGWPFPYGGVDGDFYPARFVVDLGISAVILVLTLLLIRRVSSWLQNDRRLGVALLWMVLGLATIWLIRQTAPGLIWPRWEPFPVRLGVSIGVSCAGLFLTWLTVHWVRRAIWKHHHRNSTHPPITSK